MSEPTKADFYVDVTFTLQRGVVSENYKRTDKPELIESFLEHGNITYNCVLLVNDIDIPIKIGTRVTIPVYLVASDEARLRFKEGDAVKLKGVAIYAEGVVKEILMRP